MLTEASPKKRAPLWLLRGEEAVRGARSAAASTRWRPRSTQFAAALRRENHTLKRALTDPRLFSGIGNAYSDEILHARAALPGRALPAAWTTTRSRACYEATRAVLRTWTDRLREEAGRGFPEKVTAFREGMAVHGRYRQALPGLRLAGAAHRPRRQRDQLLPHAARPAGRLLADRSLSRLLKEDWPRSLEELEETRAATRSRMQGPG